MMRFRDERTAADGDDAHSGQLSTAIYVEVRKQIDQSFQHNGRINTDEITFEMSLSLERSGKK
jgi:hypothetical protein